MPCCHPLRLLALGVSVVLGVAGPAAAAITAGVPDALSPEPLERAALVAMPAVWQVQVTTRMRALRTKNGTIISLPPGAREVSRVGTAFAVTPTGYLVTASHVVHPSAADLARAAYLTYLVITGKPHSERIAARWVDANDATPVGVGSVQRVVRPTVAGPAARAEHAVASPVVVTTDELRDIAVLHVPGLRNAPSLGLDRGFDHGTPIAALGFGDTDPFAGSRRGALVPSVRLGVIGQTGGSGGDSPQVLTPISNDVQRGDSGGPAVDAYGRVRGALLVTRAEGGGAMVPTEELLRVLDRANVRGSEGSSQFLYRAALERVAYFDLTGARADLQRTLTAYPAHGLAAYEIARLDDLGGARLALAGRPWYREGLVAAAITALVIATFLGVLLWKAVNRRPDGLRPRDRTVPFDQDDGPDDPHHLT